MVAASFAGSEKLNGLSFAVMGLSSVPIPLQGDYGIFKPIF